MTIEVNRDALPEEVMEALVSGVRMDHAYSKNLDKPNGNGRKKHKESTSDCEDQPATSLEPTVPSVEEKAKPADSSDHDDKTPDPSKDGEQRMTQAKTKKTVNRKENTDHSYQQEKPEGKTAARKRKSAKPDTKTIPAKRGRKSAKAASVKPPASAKSGRAKKNASKTQVDVTPVISKSGTKLGTDQKQSSTQTRKRPERSTKPKAGADKVQAKRLAKLPVEKLSTKKSADRVKKPIGRPRKLKRTSQAAPTSTKAGAPRVRQRKQLPTYTNKGVPSGNIMVTNILHDRTRRRTVDAVKEKK